MNSRVAVSADSIELPLAEKAKVSISPACSFECQLWSA